MKDYYRALGVAESASAADIKKAYRKLAKENHPDATGGDVKKGERFKEVSEAYSILSDQTKRTQYDELRKNPYAQNAQWGGETGVDISDIFAQFFGGGRAGQAAGGFNGGRVTFHVGGMDGQGGGGFEDIFGDVLGGSRGRGRRSGGRGRARHSAVVELDLKEAALGTVKTISASGQTVEVRIPAGVDTGARLRAGSLSLEIRVRPHPALRREGSDLHTELAIGPDEAILGAKIDVPTLEGSATLTIPAGTSAGSTLRLRGKGVGSPSGRRGDQYVHIRIVVPKQVPERARELIEEFARIVRFNPRV